MSNSRMDPDSTIALLSEALPGIPGVTPKRVPNYPEDEDSEEEVFFGAKSDKENNGKNSK